MTTPEQYDFDTKCEMAARTFAAQKEPNERCGGLKCDWDNGDDGAHVFQCEGCKRFVCWCVGASESDLCAACWSQTDEAQQFRRTQKCTDH